MDDVKEPTVKFAGKVAIVAGADSGLGQTRIMDGGLTVNWGA